MRATIATLILFLLATATQSAEVVWEVSPDKTSQDVPLSLEVQRERMSNQGYTVWGKVRNDKSEEIFENVNIILTAYGENKEFLGRIQASVSPSKLRPGDVGYFNEVGIDTDYKTPVRIEWKTITSRY